MCCMAGEGPAGVRQRPAPVDAAGVRGSGGLRGCPGRGVDVGFHSPTSVALCTWERGSWNPSPGSACPGGDSPPMCPLPPPPLPRPPFPHCEPESHLHSLNFTSSARQLGQLSSPGLSQLGRGGAGGAPGNHAWCLGKEEPWGGLRAVRSGWPHRGQAPHQAQGHWPG